MTAEVAVLNTTGIALAADSAVTIGEEATKIYTSAEKLFQLSNCSPVGAMIYGNASFMGLPWETTIKTYRKKLGSSTFNTVEDYAIDFLSFIRKERSLFPKKRQDDVILSLVARFYLFLRSEMAKRINFEAEKGDGLDEEDLPVILDTVVQNYLSTIQGKEYLYDFESRDRPIIRKKYSSAIGKIKKEIFGNLPFATATIRKLTTIIIELLVRNYLGPAKSGLVFAGFGDNEYLPVLVHYEFEEMVLDRPRCVMLKTERIDTNSNASVLAFAQKDMVYSFMQGITEELSNYMIDSTSNLFAGSIAIILEEIEKTDPALGKEIEQLVNNNFPDLLRKLFGEWDELQSQYWSPVIQIVSTLPKDELAAMAENLVNLTKFRRRVTTDYETVGGPIDVAVITKGDGFIWIKRKHYFEPEYNRRVIARLEKEAQ